MIKKHPPALIVQPYANRGGSQSYRITHSPSAAILADCFYFRNTALAISKEIIVYLGDNLRSENISYVSFLFTQAIRDYIEAFRFSEDKKPPSMEDWLNGPDYQRVLADRNTRAILERQEKEYAEELHHGFESVGWFPAPDGTVARDDMERVRDGRPLPGEGVS